MGKGLLFVIARLVTLEPGSAGHIVNSGDQEQLYPGKGSLMQKPVSLSHDEIPGKRYTI